jgi:hypothetical protein
MMGVPPRVDAWAAGAGLDAEIAHRLFGDQAAPSVCADLLRHPPANDTSGRDEARYSTDMSDTWRIVERLRLPGVPREGDDVPEGGRTATEPP